MSDWLYRFGRLRLDQTIRLYYRRIEVVGRERMKSRKHAGLGGEDNGTVPV